MIPTPITMLTNYPIRAIIHKSDVLGRLLKWVIELNEYEIYKARVALMGQALANYVIEISGTDNEEASHQSKGCSTIEIDRSLKRGKGEPV